MKCLIRMMYVSLSNLLRRNYWGIFYREIDEYFLLDKRSFFFFYFIFYYFFFFFRNQESLEKLHIEIFI